MKQYNPIEKLFQAIMNANDIERHFKNIENQVDLSMQTLNETVPNLDSEELDQLLESSYSIESGNLIIDEITNEFQNGIGK